MQVYEGRLGINMRSRLRGMWGLPLLSHVLWYLGVREVFTELPGEHFGSTHFCLNHGGSIDLRAFGAGGGGGGVLFW